MNVKRGKEEPEELPLGNSQENRPEAGRSHWHKVSQELQSLQ